MKKPPVRQPPNEKTHVAKYGIWFPRMRGAPPNSAGIDTLQAADIEKRILRYYDQYARQSSQILPWVEHYQKFVSIIWGSEASGRRFVWNPNAIRMLEKVYEMAANSNKMYLSVAGHASSSKSEFFAIYAILSFLLGEAHPSHPEKGKSPEFVKVFVTSTTLEDSRNRIWGTIEKYWLSACQFFGGEQYMMAKLVSSMGKIVRVDPTNGKQDGLAGIVLIAGGKGQDKDVDNKIGFKNRKVVMVADELPLLTHKLYESAIGNLASNEVLQFIGLGNPTSPFDPFGIMSEPKDGWKSVDESYDGWDTKNGYCIRFDGEKSPNVLAGREIYPGLLSLETLQAWKAQFGEKHPEYYRMARGFMSPDGDMFAIYTSAEILGTLSNTKVSSWVEPPVLCAFLDPAFSQGGDEADMSVCRVGRMFNAAFQKEVNAIELISVENLMLKVNATDKERDRNTQLVDLYHSRCEKLGIKTEDRGVDSTGAGDPFSTLMAMKMGRGFQMVSFAGGPSDKPVSPTDRRLGTERFANRVSELWYVGKELMKGGQIRGLDPDTCIQMCSRLYKGGGKEKVEVEPKAKMKTRTNGKKSPDRADSFFGCVEIARRRHGLSSAARAAPGKKSAVAGSGDRAWDALSGMQAKRKAQLQDLSTPSLRGDAGAGWGGYF